jgi:hypothetical protein
MTPSDCLKQTRGGATLLSVTETRAGIAGPNRVNVTDSRVALRFEATPFLSGKLPEVPNQIAVISISNNGCLVNLCNG